LNGFPGTAVRFGFCCDCRQRVNDFLKEHKKVGEQQATIAQLKSTLAQQQKSFQVKARGRGCKEWMRSLNSAIPNAEGRAGHSPLANAFEAILYQNYR
jgi:hypothetical protein